ncbi:MAG TPA: M20/M25/M40 family metallo-hydrolase [Candidatus Acidoferrales bacterium]|nr:M20/M25/M40 family metallo-hydrolase [Candidatus Acidoferrales bacterium]
MARRTLLYGAMIAALCAAPIASQLPQNFPAPPGPPSSAQSTDQLAQEALGWLQGLIRINTTNPPGNETEAAKYVSEILSKESIPNEVLEMSPGRSIVVGRLNAGAMPNATRALLLLAHLDVVGVSREKWSVDPFGAEIKEGYIWGRGTIDDKGMLIANLAAIVALKRANMPLDRDVIFLADDDEEQGGEASIKPAIQKYWDKFAAGFAINEEGRVIVNGGKVQYVGIQASEKVAVNVNVIATGTSGHGSVPRPDNAVVHLAAAVAKIGDYQAPVNLSTIVERYFETLSKVEDDEIGKWMRALETPEREQLAVKRLADMSPVWNSMMRDTIAPTMLQAGVRANVVPSEARATLNIRLLPGDSVQLLIGVLTQLVNDKQVRFEVAADPGTPAPASSLESELYRTIEKVSGQEFPGVVVAPLMSTGATDSAQLRLHNVQAYGLLPFPLTEQEVLRMHADDERLPVESFRKGVDFMCRIVQEFAARK